MEQESTKQQEKQQQTIKVNRMKKPARKTTKRLGPTTYTNYMACSHQIVPQFKCQGSMEHPHISFHYMPPIVTHLLNHKRTINPKVVAVNAAQLEHRSKSMQKSVKESGGGWRNCIYNPQLLPSKSRVGPRASTCSSAWQGRSLAKEPCDYQPC